MTGTTAEIISMAYNPIWYARSNSVLTMNFLKNKIIRKAIIGEISKPLLLMLVGILFLIGLSIGSVNLWRKKTIILRGSGLTQLINALITIIQLMSQSTTLIVCAAAVSRLAIINIVI